MEALELLDTPEQYLEKRIAERAEDNFLRRLEIQKHYYLTVIAGLEGEIEILRDRLAVELVKNLKG
jgi:hypothetical protein